MVAQATQVGCIQQGRDGRTNRIGLMGCEPSLSTQRTCSCVRPDEPDLIPGPRANIGKSTTTVEAPDVLGPMERTAVGFRTVGVTTQQVETGTLEEPQNKKRQMRGSAASHRGVQLPAFHRSFAPLAQLVEHSPCKRNVNGSIPLWGSQMG